MVTERQDSAVDKMIPQRRKKGVVSARDKMNMSLSAQVFPCTQRWRC